MCISRDPPPQSILEDPRKELFKAAMNRDWNKVFDLYTDEQVQRQYITRANDTLLHVAISGATEKTVLGLLDIVVRHNETEICNILSLKNKAGDTPLHLAAALGQDKVCRRLAKMCPELVTNARNNLQETPLFSAVRYRKKNAFFVLEVAIHMEQNRAIDNDRVSREDISYCTRYDGNNILHYAIKGEQFDLAYDIIRLYPQLVYKVNSCGETALHTLANKPSVFKSGARFDLFEKILYCCTTTKPLKFKFVDFLENEKDPLDIQEDEKSKVLPPTYQVCVDLFSLMKDLTRCIFYTVASSSKNAICKACCADEENPDSSIRANSVDEENLAGAQKKDEQRRRCPPNYIITISFFKIIAKLLYVFLGGLGIRRLETITKLKQKHIYAKEIMKDLVKFSILWKYEEGGMEPTESSLSYDERSKPPSLTISIETTGPWLDEKTLNPGAACATESPVLVAAKKGIIEMVERILSKYPVAIFDQDKDAKNIVLLAVEHRQVQIYEYMLRVPNMESVFSKVDKEGNSALHLAAMVSDSRLWSTGAALHIQWEIKWYKYVRSSMDRERFATTNNAGKMPEEVFIESHDTLVKEGITGLTNTCQSCSVVAALFATVAFQSVSTVPGGVDQQSGFPILSKRPTFQLFAISSLVALCFSVTSVVMFLAVLISNFKVWDFERRLPMKLIIGLTTLFMAIASTLVAFCAGDFFVVEYDIKFAAYPIYGIMCFPIIYFAVAQYPLYLNLIFYTFKKVVKPEMVQDN